MSKVFLYSFESARWKELVQPEPGSFGWLRWSNDSRYLYAQNGPKIYRCIPLEGAFELVADSSGIPSVGPVFPGAFSLTPDNQVIITRDRGSDELYALDLEYR